MPGLKAVGLLNEQIFKNALGDLYFRGIQSDMNESIRSVKLNKALWYGGNRSFLVKIGH